MPNYELDNQLKTLSIQAVDNNPISKTKSILVEMSILSDFSKGF